MGNALRDRLKARALALPGAWEDHPWGEDVVKVNKKIFVFLGMPADDAYPYTVGVKLDASLEEALGMPGAKPSGYGLGRAGWVQLPLTGEHAPEDLLLEWVEESYRRVATRKLIAELDAG